MAVDTNALQAWLLQTIPGVIILGAVGSIVAALLIYLSRLTFRALAMRRDELIVRLMYPFGKNLDIAERFQKAHGPKDSDGQYLAYVVYCAATWVSEAVMLFISLAVSMFVYLLFALERPLVLSSCIGVTLLFAASTLKGGLFLVGLVSNEMLVAQKAAHDAQPKTFTEWRRSRSTARDA